MIKLLWKELGPETIQFYWTAPYAFSIEKVSTTEEAHLLAIRFPQLYAVIYPPFVWLPGSVTGKPGDTVLFEAHGPGKVFIEIRMHPSKGDILPKE